MTPIDRLLATARVEIGYLEKHSNDQLNSKTGNAGDNNYTKFASDLDKIGFYNGRKNGYAWCAVFCDWCFVKTFGLDLALQMTGQKLGGYGAGCTESVNYYKKIGRFYRYEPKPGDQIFFTQNNGQSFYHTGLVEKVQSGRVFTIEGNTSSAKAVVENGGSVQAKSYLLSHKNIGGYGRPNYSLIVDTIPKNPLQKEEEEVTQEQFNKMMDNYLDELAKKQPSSWSESDRLWAESIGLIKGDENGNKQYKSFTTREAMVTFLKRLYDTLNK